MEVSRGDIQRLYNDRADYSSSVARLTKTVMNVSMKYAVDKKVASENPAEGINLPKKVEKKAYRTRVIDEQKTMTLDQVMMLLDQYQLPDVSWHHLRTTFCTILLKNDFNPKAVSRLMGHASEIITMDKYGDKRQIIADCTNELQPYIDEVLAPDEEEEWDMDFDDGLIPPAEYLSVDGEEKML